MKNLKNLKIVVLCLFVALFSFSSCEDNIFSNGHNMVWDIAPVRISFYVKDYDGRDLLSPSYEENILNNKIKVLYNGEEYPLNVDMSEVDRGDDAKTRAYMPIMRGLSIDKFGNDHYLKFGEIDGAKSQDIILVVDWGDGTKDTIRVIHKFRWKNNGYPDSETDYYLNNKRVDSGFTIIK